jgi:hypothetical protein
VVSIEGVDRRKFPRLLLAHPDGQFDKLEGLQFLWPKGGKSQILDLSYSGLAISSQGFLDSVKLGDYIEAHILLPGEEQLQIPVSVRVVRKTAQIIGLRIDSTSPEGRIKIDQVMKDFIVAENVRKMSPHLLHSSLQCDVWYHGPFDTNLFLWKDGLSLVRAYIEYDNTVLVYEEGNFRVARTASTSDEAQGYGGPFLIKNFSEQKLSLGHGWIDRLQRLLIRIPNGKEDIQLVFDLLQKKKMGI